MNQKHFKTIAIELKIRETQVNSVAELLEDGATVPFIARYRKEMTESLDEVLITTIRDRLSQLKELDLRKEAIIKSLEQNGHLTEDLEKRVNEAETLAGLEDIYLPYRPKRRTKASIAREKGLEPLALLIFEQKGLDPAKEAQKYIDPEKGVKNTDDALLGAKHIMAEMINEDENARTLLRALFESKATIKSTVAKGKEVEGAKYRDYFDWEEPAERAPSHRILAMRRGEKEDILNLTISPSPEEAMEILEKLFVKSDLPDSSEVRLAALDSYKRLLSRSMETEIRIKLKEKADAHAIKVFADNLRQLLMAPPLGSKRIMGVDPGFRTGCKIVCLDPQGKFLANDTIFPHSSEKKQNQANEIITSLCRKFRIEAIAVGNGTAGRETETFLKSLIIPGNPRIIMVNESGASVYSASDTAREEFPDHDLTVRGAVSIGRRLMDPLAELVKIDPKSIGVGQYQHDVDQVELKKSLDDVVASCVNKVGVDLNRASVQLLTYVSGLGPGLAKKIVAFRDSKGAFKSREMLKQVPRLGPMAFQQAAGFLRIPESGNPLDASGVHPETYYIVDSMAKDLNTGVKEMMQSDQLREKIDISQYITNEIGIPTLEDIVAELAKPGRDPRDEFEEFAFAGGIEKITDLRSGMKLPGIVTNVTAFGAFVDVGVHQDGLVHVSQISDRFVKDPGQVLKVNQKVNVIVMEIDLARNRISLSMKNRQKPSQTGKSGKIEPQAAVSVNPKKAQKKAKRHGPDKGGPFNNPFKDAFNSKHRGG